MNTEEMSKDTEIRNDIELKFDENTNRKHLNIDEIFGDTVE